MDIVESMVESMEHGLVTLAPELVHKVALSGMAECGRGWCVGANMSSTLVDGYGRDLHMALQGVVENVKRRRWRSVKYAVNRRWYLFGEEEVCFGTEGSDG